jgi:hypothetical protein
MISEVSMFAPAMAAFPAALAALTAGDGAIQYQPRA